MSPNENQDTVDKEKYLSEMMFWEEIEQNFSEGAEAWMLFDIDSGALVNLDWPDIPNKKAIFLFLRESDALEWFSRIGGIEHPINQNRGVQARKVLIFEAKRLIDEQPNAKDYEIALLPPNVIDALSLNPENE